MPENETKAIATPDPDALPDFLDRNKGMTPEQIEADKAKVKALVERESKTEPRMPVKAAPAPAAKPAEQRADKAKPRKLNGKAIPKGEPSRELPPSGKAALRLIHSKENDTMSTATHTVSKPKGKLPVPPPKARESVLKGKSKAKPISKAKLAKAAKGALKAKGEARPDGLRAGSKMALAIDMICAKGGATCADIAKKLGWSVLNSSTLRRYAETAKVKIREEEKEGEASRFYGTPRAS